MSVSAEGEGGAGGGQRSSGAAGGGGSSSSSGTLTETVSIELSVRVRGTSGEFVTVACGADDRWCHAHELVASTLGVDLACLRLYVRGARITNLEARILDADNVSAAAVETEAEVVDGCVRCLHNLRTELAKSQTAAQTNEPTGEAPVMARDQVALNALQDALDSCCREQLGVNFSLSPDYDNIFSWQQLEGKERKAVVEANRDATPFKNIKLLSKLRTAELDKLNDDTHKFKAEAAYSRLKERLLLELPQYFATRLQGYEMNIRLENFKMIAMLTPLSQLKAETPVAPVKIGSLGIRSVHNRNWLRFALLIIDYCRRRLCDILKASLPRFLRDTTLTIIDLKRQCSVRDNDEECKLLETLYANPGIVDEFDTSLAVKMFERRIRADDILGCERRLNPLWMDDGILGRLRKLVTYRNKFLGHVSLLGLCDGCFELLWNETLDIFVSLFDKNGHDSQKDLARQRQVIDELKTSAINDGDARWPRLEEMIHAKLSQVQADTNQLKVDTTQLKADAEESRVIASELKAKVDQHGAMLKIGLDAIGADMANFGEKIDVLMMQVPPPPYYGVWEINLEKGGLFAGRADLLAHLDSLLHPSAHQVTCVRIVLTGMGGAGKSLLALKAATSARERFRHGWKLDGSTYNTLVADLAKVARSLQLECKPDEVVATIRSCLSRSQHAGWLFVVDNVDDRDVQEHILDLLPQLGGCLLVTSRRSFWDIDAGWITVAVPDRMKMEEALHVLLGTSEVSPMPRGVVEVATELAMLPLALTQARSYVKKTLRTVSIADLWVTYLVKLREQASRLPSKKKSEVNKATLASLRLSLESAQRDHDAVHWLVQILQVMSEASAPCSIVTDAFCQLAPESDCDEALAVLADFSIVSLSEGVISTHPLMQLAMTECIPCGQQALAVLSTVLITKSKIECEKGVSELYSIRSQYAKVILAIEQTSPESIDLRKVLFNFGVVQYLLGDKMMKQTFEKIIVIDRARLGETNILTSITMVNLGIAHGLLGEHIKQVELLERALEIQEFRYPGGKFDARLSSTLLHLGDAYESLGHWEKMSRVCYRALVLAETSKGPDHPNLVSILVRNAKAHCAFGDFERSKTELDRALVIAESRCGMDHRDTASVLVGLGSAWTQFVGSESAKPFLERALGILERYFGSENIHLVDVLNKLANIYDELGNRAQHMLLLKRSLTIAERQYGTDHFEFAKALACFSDVYAASGEFDHQVLALERAVSVFEIHIGACYPSRPNEPSGPVALIPSGNEHFAITCKTTAMALTKLSIAYGAVGNKTKQVESINRATQLFEQFESYENAKIALALASIGIQHCGTVGGVSNTVKLLEHALTTVKRYYGPEHAINCYILYALGLTYAHLGDAVMQKAALETGVGIADQHFGAGECILAGILSSLGDAYGNLHEFSKQTSVLERLLEITESQCGPDHDDVAKVLNRLATAYGGLDDVSRQCSTLQRSVAIQEHLNGVDNIELGKALRCLAESLHRLGDFDMELTILERAMTIYRTCQGPDSLESLKTLTMLGNVYGALGDRAKQKALLEKVLSSYEKCGPHMKNHQAPAIFGLADVFAAMGDPFNERRMLRRLSDIFEATRGENDLAVVHLLIRLGESNAADGNAEEHKFRLEQALDILERAHGHEQELKAMILNRLGNANGSLSNFREQIRLQEQAIEILEGINQKGRSNQDIASFMCNLARAHGKVGDCEKKKLLLEKALGILDRTHGPNCVELVTVLNSLAYATSALGDHHKAVCLLDRALAISRVSDAGTDSARTANINNSIGEVLAASGAPSFAIGYYNEVNRIYCQLGMANSRENAANLASLADVLAACGDNPGALEAATASLQIFDNQPHSWPVSNNEYREKAIKLIELFAQLPHETS